MKRHADRCRIAAGLLPDAMKKGAVVLGDDILGSAEEFRLRVMEKPTILCGTKEISFSEYMVSPLDFQTVLERATEHSAWKAADHIRNGYVTVRGGFRVGICGSVVLKEGHIATISEISSISIRIARQVIGIADALCDSLFENSFFRSTLIIAPPGGGKTTLLRDLIRCLSNGGTQRAPLRVCVADERGEIAAAYQGVPQFDIGTHTDVLTGAAKKDAILMLLRSMNPQVIALDEISDPRDIQTISAAGNCGVSFLATVHGRDLNELRNKTLFRELLESKLFSQYLICERLAGERVWHLEHL